MQKEQFDDVTALIWSLIDAAQTLNNNKMLSYDALERIQASIQEKATWLGAAANHSMQA